MLWDYHRLGHALRPADAIVVLCSHDTRVADRAAELFADGLAPLVIMSGGLGAITRDLLTRPEAEVFADVAAAAGVPRDRIVTETRSTNTGENVLFTRQLLDQRGIQASRLIVVQKPYMERRAFATFRKVWPGPELIVTSPQVSMHEYLATYAHASLTAADVVSIMVGDLQRIRVYPQRGFQIPQEIPAPVWEAYEQLVERGFGGRLVNEQPPLGPS